tara:strand:+ start:15973 stop:16188 length:216 start_codon:yes stop_codon:yes gene_type:complete
MPSTPNELKVQVNLDELSFEDAEHYYELGIVSEEQWYRYCYEWRATVPRFTASGRWEAQQYARAHNLPEVS